MEDNNLKNHLKTLWNKTPSAPQGEFDCLYGKYEQSEAVNTFDFLSSPRFAFATLCLFVCTISFVSPELTTTLSNQESFYTSTNTIDSESLGRLEDVMDLVAQK